jgi:hypothetical protein
MLSEAKHPYGHHGFVVGVGIPRSARNDKIKDL